MISLNRTHKIIIIIGVNIWLVLFLVRDIGISMGYSRDYITENKLLMDNHGWLSNAEYEYIYSRVPRACVDIMIIKDDNILLTFRNDPPYQDNWHVIGGRIEMFETVSDAAIRHVQKETGLTINKHELIFTDYAEFLDETMPTYNGHSISFVFEYKLDSNVIINETDARKWYHENNLPKNIVAQHLEVIKRFYQIET